MTDNPNAPKSGQMAGENVLEEDPTVQHRALSDEELARPASGRYNQGPQFNPNSGQFPQQGPPSQGPPSGQFPPGYPPQGGFPPGAYPGGPQYAQGQYPPMPQSGPQYAPGPQYAGGPYPPPSQQLSGPQYPQGYPGGPPSTGQPYGYQTGQVMGTGQAFPAQQPMGMRTSLPEPGELIAGRYEILSELGVGGFGAVYKAHQRGLNKEVAVKVLLPQAASIEGAAARFRREAMLAKELTHPNTITLYDYGQSDDGLTYIVMELLEGGELQDEIKRSGGMPPKRVRRIASQVLKSLAEAHAHGIVHRDLKPANIMLVEVYGEKDYVKVLDFGIARAFTDHAEDFKTRTGTIIGTPQYMSPEQLKGGDVGGHTDLYAMGLIMAEMLTGKPVFHDENTNMIIVAQLSPSDVPLDQEKVLNSPLGAVIQKATQKDISKRYATALEMLEDLDQSAPAAAVEVSESAPAARPGLQTAKPGQVIGKTEPPIAPAAEKKRSLMVPILLVLLLLGGAAAGGAYMLMQQQKNNAGGGDGGGGGGETTTQNQPANQPNDPNQNVAAVTDPGQEPPQQPVQQPVVPQVSPAQAEARQFGNREAMERWRIANMICMRAAAAATPAAPVEEDTEIRLMLMSEPSGATIVRGEAEIGTTPFNQEIAMGEGMETLTLRLENHQEETIDLDLSQDAFVTENVVLAAIVPEGPTPEEIEAARRAAEEERRQRRRERREREEAERAAAAAAEQADSDDTQEGEEDELVGIGTIDVDADDEEEEEDRSRRRRDDDDDDSSSSRRRDDDDDDDFVGIGAFDDEEEEEEEEEEGGGVDVIF